MICEWHESSNTEPISPGALKSQGIFAAHVSTGDEKATVEFLKASRGYTHDDEVEIGPDHPKLEELKAAWMAEHRHAEDEVRMILKGGGIFDIRDSDNSEDGWIRIEVGPGDLLIVPAGRYHRFFLTDENTVRAFRMFKNEAGWIADYR